MWHSLLRQCIHHSKTRGYKQPRLLKNVTRGLFTSLRQQQLGVATKTPHASVGLTDKLRIGDVIHGFVVKEIDHVPEFQLTAVRLIHEATQGEYLHIDRDDTNNAFSVGFRTTPTDSTGLPHILEHTTLCGSTKYPCRDPFFKMLNRSLATFMNAMTGPDFTIYPFSTQNIKDYENLMSVYLDAVFRPNLNVTDFSQEGWRLEHADPQDPSSPIIIKGVVFNEMKGVFSENQNIFYEALQNHILPSNTYGVCSGGDPIKIPDLTHQDLKTFHDTYYSPSNTRYYSYGNFPLHEHLKYINEVYLRSAKLDPKVKTLSSVPDEKRWTEPVRKHITCRPDPLAADPNKVSSIAVSYLCSSVTDIDEVFAWQILSELLVRGPNSAFYKSLVETNIGSGFSPVTGYSPQTKDTVFSVGLQGVSEKDFDLILQKIDETIDEVIEKGFEKAHLEAILHSIELNTKHQSSDFGLSLLFNLISLWIHEGDIVRGMKVEEQVNRFKKALKENPDFLKQKVKHYLKDNKHKLILTMSPDAEYEKNLKQMEEEVLKKKLGNLTEADKKAVYENGLELLKQQSKEQDTSCLPTLRTKDLSKDIELLKYHDVSINGVPFQILEQPTNGITYFRGILNTQDIDPSLKPYLPLFSHVCTKMGTKTHGYKEFDQLVQLKTGGLTFGTHIRDATSGYQFEEGLVFGSYCLNYNVSEMFDLWAQVINEVDFSNAKRFDTLAKVNAANLVNGIADSGHHYAMSLSSSLVSGSGLLREHLGGLTYVNHMKNVANDTGSALENIRKIADTLLGKKRFRCCLNIVNGSEKEAISNCEQFLSNISGSNEHKIILKDSSQCDQSKGLFYVLPMNVSYTSKSVLAVPYEHQDYAPLKILSRLVTMKYLLHEIREKGGAYGAGLSLTMSGVLSFYSYRDPNPVNSFQVYDSLLSWLKNKRLKTEDVEEAKLGVFQSIDAPTPPGSKGLRRFLHGIDDLTFQKGRLDLMEVTKEDVYRVADKYLSNDVPSGRSIIGPDNKTLLETTQHNWSTFNN